ncbi:MAG: hypothetical protein HKN50_07385 [Gammaproteobacteria bacterium]|nr:hypothetical protein [Gammaproteobacteria bacterium]
MNLLIKKYISKRRLGVFAFVLYVRLEADEGELRLLDQCNLMSEPIIKPPQIKGNHILEQLFNLAESKQAKLHNAIEGHELVCERIEEVGELENVITESCLALQANLLTAQVFDEERVIDLTKLLEDKTC